VSGSRVVSKIANPTFYTSPHMGWGPVAPPHVRRCINLSVFVIENAYCTIIITQFYSLEM